MRDALSDLIVATARKDDRFVVLSGDHGYALFDAIRAERPKQFVNVGVAEQNMIGVAAGLAKVGFRPCVYGLAAFVPIRVLEQIKLDLCHSGLPVILLGDGAGLVYSTLGASHQCGEDVACLRSLPRIAVYSPCDASELESCWTESLSAGGPSYIRIGKADRPATHSTSSNDTEPRLTNAPAIAPSSAASKSLVVATGSMVYPATAFARVHGIACLSVPRLKPLPDCLFEMLSQYNRVCVLEEHVQHGGLWTGIVEGFAMRQQSQRPGAIDAIALTPAFTATAGSHQCALAEHGMSDDHVARRLGKWLSDSPAT